MDWSKVPISIIWARKAAFCGQKRPDCVEFETADRLETASNGRIRDDKFQFMSDRVTEQKIKKKQ